MKGKRFMVAAVSAVLAGALCAVFAACGGGEEGGKPNGGTGGGAEPHRHAFTHSEPKAATCVDAGTAEYWYCAECGKYFSDGNGNTEISSADLTLPATGLHRFEENVCRDCDLEWIATDGLEFTLDGDAYTVSGIGTASGDVVIPYYYEGKPVTAIKESAFNACTVLTGVAIPDSVTEIGAEAFNACTKLVSVTLPQGLAEISTGMFLQCKALTGIVIPESITAIRNSAFNRCLKLKEISIPDSVSVIEHDAFANCKELTEIALPKNIVSIESMTFYTCTALVKVTVPEGVTTIGKAAFQACRSLTDIHYLGSQDKWETIEKGEDWNTGTGELIVHYGK